MMWTIRSCYRDELNYTRQVRISWKSLSLILLAAGPLLLGGCGGVSASHTFSPLDFLLPGVGPGILKASPPQTNAPVIAISSPVTVACTR